MCEIEIKCLVGINLNAEGIPQQIAVVGTSRDCDGIEVIIQNPYGGASPVKHAKFNPVDVPCEVSPDSGEIVWIATFEAQLSSGVIGELPGVPIQLRCGLQSRELVIKAWCEADTSCDDEQAFESIQCPCSYEVTGTYEETTECVGNRRKIVFTLNFSPPLPAGSQVDIDWSFAYPPISTQDQVAVEAETASHSKSHLYPAGTYYPSAFVTITVDGILCEEQSLEWTVHVQEGCETLLADCPKARILPPKAFGCSPQNPYVFFSAGLSADVPDDPPPEYLWTVTAPNGEQFQRRTGSKTNSQELWLKVANGASGPLDLNTAGTYTVRVEVDVPNAPEDCRPPVATDAFTIEECPEIDCPEITGITAAEGDCLDSGDERPVALTAQTNGVIAGEFTWDFGDGDSEQSSGPTVSHNYAPGVSYTVRVTASGPAECDDDLEFVDVITVPECRNGDGEQNGDGSINWCLITMIAMLILMGIGALLLIIGICLLGVPEPTTVTKWVGGIMTGIGAFMLILGFVIFMLWLYFCGTVPSNCWLLGLLLDIFIFLAAISLLLTIVVGVIAAIFGDLVCWLGFGIDFAYFATLAFIVLWFMRFVGCRPYEDWVPENLRWTIPDEWRFGS